MKTGLAFQIQDDLLSLLSNEDAAHKDLLSDIKEGKRTYVLLKALELASPNQRARLKEILNSSKLTKADIIEYKGIFERSGAIDESIAFANRLSTHAKSILNHNLKDSKAKELRLSMADWCKDRLQ